MTRFVLMAASDCRLVLAGPLSSRKSTYSALPEPVPEKVTRPLLDGERTRRPTTSLSLKPATTGPRSSAAHALSASADCDAAASKVVPNRSPSFGLTSKLNPLLQVRRLLAPPPVSVNEFVTAR